MRIVITGGTGFLGKLVVARLAGHEVIALGRSKPQASEAVAWIDADLSEPLDAARLPAKADALIHLAQSPRYGDFPVGAADVFAVNVETPARLLRWAAGAGVSRAVLASTGTVYEPYAGPLREAAAVHPTGYYGASKLACETLSLAYQKQFAVAQLRLFFLYGPGQKAMLIPRLIDAIANGRPVTLPREGEGMRLVPTYGCDAARVLVQALEDSWRGIWNVASPHALSMGELFQVIGQAVGRAPVVQRSDQPPPPPIVPDLAKLAGRFDLAGFVAPAAGIARTVAGG